MGGFFSKLFGKVKEIVNQITKPRKSPNITDSKPYQPRGNTKNLARDYGVNDRTIANLPKQKANELERHRGNYSTADEMRAYRDEILEIMSAFNFPEEQIEAVESLTIDEIRETDFQALNAANERMRRYIDAYIGGYIDDFETDWYFYQLQKSIPALSN